MDICYVCLDDLNIESLRCKLPNCSHWIHTRCMLECLSKNNTLCGKCRAPIMDNIKNVPVVNSETNSLYTQPQLFGMGIYVHDNGNSLQDKYPEPQSTLVWKSILRLHKTHINQDPLMTQTELKRKIQNLRQLVEQTEGQLCIECIDLLNHVRNVYNFRKSMKRATYDSLAVQYNIQGYKKKNMDDLLVLLQTHILPLQEAACGVFTLN